MHFPVEKIATPTFYYSLFPTWSWICMEKRIKKKKVKKKQQEGRRIDHLRRKGLHPPPGFIPIKRTLWYHHNPGIPFNLYTLFWVEKGGYYTTFVFMQTENRKEKRYTILHFLHNRQYHLDMEHSTSSFLYGQQLWTFLCAKTICLQVDGIHFLL